MDDMYPLYWTMLSSVRRVHIRIRKLLFFGHFKAIHMGTFIDEFPF